MQHQFKTCLHLNMRCVAHYSLLSVLLTLVTCDQQPPNIILIVSDDLGYNDVSWHNPAMVTPHMEALVRGGVRLEQSYVQPICTPTRSALMTGKYPIHTGITSVS